MTVCAKYTAHCKYKAFHSRKFLLYSISIMYVYLLYMKQWINKEIDIILKCFFLESLLYCTLLYASNPFEI